MRSVADDLRADVLSRLRSMPPAERVALAFGLGDEDLNAFMRARGLTRADALAALRRRRQDGRPSRCATEDAG
jgi:hypothetical protein